MSIAKGTGSFRNKYAPSRSSVLFNKENRPEHNNSSLLAPSDFRAMLANLSLSNTTTPTQTDLQQGTSPESPNQQPAEQVLYDAAREAANARQRKYARNLLQLNYASLRKNLKDASKKAPQELSEKTAKTTSFTISDGIYKTCAKENFAYLDQNYNTIKTIIDNKNDVLQKFLINNFYQLPQKKLDAKEGDKENIIDQENNKRRAPEDKSEPNNPHLQRLLYKQRFQPRQTQNAISGS
jgi:hypothetical protein